MASKGPILCEYELKPILSDYGIVSGKESLINSADEAVTLSKEYDGPVALKIQSPDILHKTEAGGLALNLIGEEDRVKILDLLLKFLWKLITRSQLLIPITILLM